ncbi:Protein of unknown function DUF569 [Macleaya cordata]|uniref:DUF569 domain-containing protein n=1 Tax=Macleaya cordata TaxID=56857 RepID=A0A200QF14_MACCD|nr:Protein of unknown function DUF569 [Macleaya cordata]
MEFFTKAAAVRLRSHLDKYLIADENEESVRQSRKGSSPRVKWIVEIVDGKNNLIRLKSCYGKYLTATDTPFLLGMTGKKILQTHQSIKKFDSSTEWEPIRDGFQVRLKNWEGKFLRANGATPPWRNSVTHDVPHRSATLNWALWDVDLVDLTENDRSSSFSSLSEDPVYSPTSPWSTMASPKFSSSQV